MLLFHADDNNVKNICLTIPPSAVIYAVNMGYSYSNNNIITLVTNLNHEVIGDAKLTDLIRP